MTTPDRVVDLALPSALPLADVLPQVLRYADPESSPDGPSSWVLARIGGVALPLSQTLVESGVLDGDVLELRRETEEARPAVVEDVRDSVEDSVDAAGGAWSTRTTGSFAVVAGSAALALAGLAAVSARLLGHTAGPARLDSTGSAVVSVLVLLGATWWAARFARPVDAQVAAGVAMGWAALLGVAVGAERGTDRWPTVALCVVLVAAAAGTGRLLTDATSGHLAFAGVVLVAGLVMAVAGSSGVPTDQVRRVLPVLAVLSVGVVPRVSLSVGGLVSADYRVRHADRLDLRTLRARYRTSNAVLVGAVSGICLVVVWAGVALESGGPWDRALACALAVALILRSRLFSRTQHMVVPRASGLLTLGLVGYQAAEGQRGLASWLVALVALVTAAAVGLASLPLSEISQARVKRTLNIIEFLVVVVMLVLMFGATGLYGQVGGLFG